MILLLAGFVVWAGPAVSDPVDVTMGLAEELLGQAPPREEMERAALQGMVAHLDGITGLGPSEVLTEKERSEFLRWELGLREGYGLKVRIVEQRGLLIDRALPEGTAAKAGILSGDLVVAIGNRPFTGLSAAEMLNLLNQPSASTVDIDVVRGGNLLRFPIQRGEFQIDNVTRTERSIEINFFGRGAAAELRNELQSYQTGCILDLRDNRGGLLEEATEAAGFFLGRDAVVGFRKHASGIEEPIVATGDLFWSDGLVLLVNKGTSGAAELFVIALQEGYKAVVVGELSAGRAVDVHFYPLSPGFFLKLGDSELLGPSRRGWHGQGLEPDVLVYSAQTLPTVSGHLVDVQLEAAVQLCSSP
jgi:carboxyl-terminal processing protease